MAAGVTIRVDPSDVVKALEGVKNGVQRAATRSINRTLVTVRAEVAREVADDIGWPINLVKNTIATRNATYSNLSGRLEASPERIPLIAFRATGPEPSYGRGPGVSYRIGRTGKILPHAFITRVRSAAQAAQGLQGHRGVFQRRAGVGRKPIVQVRGPSIPHVALQDKIRETTQALAGKTLSENLLHEIQYLLANRKGA